MDPATPVLLGGTWRGSLPPTHVLPAWWPWQWLAPSPFAAKTLGSAAQLSLSSTTLAGAASSTLQINQELERLWLVLAGPMWGTQWDEFGHQWARVWHWLSVDRQVSGRTCGTARLAESVVTSMVRSLLPQ